MRARSDPVQTSLRRCRPALLVVLLFSLAVNLLLLTAPLYMMQVFDRVLASGSHASLGYLTVVAVGALAVLSLLDAGRGHVLTRSAGWLEQRLGPTALRQALDAQLQQQEYRTEGLRDLGVVRAFASGPMVLTLFDAPWVPIYLAVVYALHPLLGHVAAAGAVVLLALTIANDRLTRGPLQAASGLRRESGRMADLAVRQAGPLEGMGFAAPAIENWRHRHDEQIRQFDRAARCSVDIASASRFARLVVQIAILAAGAWLVLGRELTPGGMIAASIIMARALAPVEAAVAGWRGVTQAREAVRRLRANLDRPPARREELSLPAPTGMLAVEEVTFQPPGATRPVLRGVSFAAAPGEIVGVTGPSAAGKSTLAALLVGIHRPASGIVRLDGADVFTWPRAAFGRHVGYLPQEVSLFPGSVAANIARLNEAADAEAIVAAAQRAGAHELILRLPDGYRTEAGEGGCHLSGGQRQRIALARALFGAPRLVVLDEPDAGLDRDGVRALEDALRALRADCATTILVTHRPNLLRHVDRVLVLDQGRVARLLSSAQLLQPHRPPAQAPSAATPALGG